VSTHLLLQLVSPLWQERTQLPDEQSCPDLQAVPQAPQFAQSLWVSTHLPLQTVSPLWQESAQVPAEQTSPALHLVPQVPQL